MTEEIYVVDAIAATLSRSRPPILGVTANGQTTTPGWTHPTLSRTDYISPPADGIQAVAFDADRPASIVPEVLTPISASCEEISPAWLKGVRVRSATNTVVTLI